MYIVILTRCNVQVGHFTLDNADNNDTFMAKLACLLASRDIDFDAKDHHLNDCQTYKDALERDPIALGCAVVQALRASGQHQDAFEDFIKEGNTKGYWEEEDKDGEAIKIKINVLQLIRDVKTCWDSVYYMIRRLRLLQQPIDAFLEQPNNKDLKKHKLSTMEWKVLKDIEVILEVPHQAMQTLSSERLPTLCKYLTTFEHFYISWKKAGNDPDNPQF
ncbi:hypothetical protein BS17DRAFT_707780 [Gyrodon lividus]|nr:hypothetical protein BS17DRAFT_707780 [Gyrodon lividus]